MNFVHNKSNPIFYFFWGAVLLHCLLWTFLPGLLQTGYRPDVIEQLFIGREWVIASARHPALPAFFLEIINCLDGRMFLSPFLASQICALLTIWGVWRLGRSVLPPKLALVSALSMLLYWFFTIESIKYNQNLPYIAFWTLTLCFLHESLKTDKLVYWIATGIAIGLGLHSKYPTILLVLSILVFFSVDAKAKRTWRHIGPYATTFTALLVFSPHLFWAMKHGFVFPRDPSSVFERSVLQLLFVPFEFLVSQIGLLVFPLLVIIPILRWPLRRRNDITEDERWSSRFLAAMILIPLLWHFLLGFGFVRTLTSDYGSPIWPTLGIWIFLQFQTVLESERVSRTPALVPLDLVARKSLRYSTLIFVAFELALVVVFLVQCVYSPYFMEKPRRFHFPMHELGQAAEQIWEERADGPCPYVTGDWWIAGNAAEGMDPPPSVHAIGSFLNMDGKDSPTSWSTDADVERLGGLIFWSVDENPNFIPETLFTRFPDAKILPTLEIPYKNFEHADPQSIGVAIVLPKNHRKIERSEWGKP